MSNINENNLSQRTKCGTIVDKYNLPVNKIKLDIYKFLIS